MKNKSVMQNKSVIKNKSVMQNKSVIKNKKFKNIYCNYFILYSFYLIVKDSKIAHSIYVGFYVLCLICLIIFIYLYDKEKKEIDKNKDQEKKETDKDKYKNTRRSENKYITPIIICGAFIWILTGDYIAYLICFKNKSFNNNQIYH